MKFVKKQGLIPHKNCNLKKYIYFYFLFSVNNAGIFFIEKDKNGNFVKKQSQDGFELIMGTNYLGHFYLTHQMLDLLKNGGTLEDPSR